MSKRNEMAPYLAIRKDGYKDMCYGMDKLKSIFAKWKAQKNNMWNYSNHIKSWK